MIPAISIQNLSKDYKNFRALKGISLEVREGEFFAFLGPNGAGKTTTISVLTGLANYSEGSVKIFGYDVMREYRETRALIGLVPQEFNFDPFLSVEQILTFEGGYFGLPWKRSKERARELLEMFSLGEKKTEGYKKLSGGMKRRLLIARALMHRPKILILDEPTAGVDLELRLQLWSFLRKLNKEGTTVVLTTHYIEEAEKLCSRVGVIHEGRIVALDTTETLVRKMSGDQVLIYMKKPLDQVPAEIRAYGVTLDEEKMILRFEEKNNATAAVLKFLHDRKFEIERVDVQKPTLEQAFLKLTSSNHEGLFRNT